VEILLAAASGALYMAGIYLMLRRRLAQLIIGLGLLSNGTNLLIFAAGGLCGPGTAGSGPDRDCHRVRFAGFLTRARAPCAHRCGHR
jgi:multisubunit Na+/H+ antiporter MnhC subunit